MIISKNLANQIVKVVKDVCRYDINFITPKGIVFSSTNPKRIDTYHEIGELVAKKRETLFVNHDGLYEGTQKGINIPVFKDNQVVAIIGLTGDPDKVKKYAFLAERITNLLLSEKTIQQENYSREEQMHFLISSLLERNNLDIPYFKNLLKNYFLDFHGTYRFVLVSFKSPSKFSDPRVKEEISQLFNNLSFTLFSYNYPHEYWGIISEENFKEIQYDLQQFSKKKVHSLNLTIGKETTLKEIQFSYESCLIALDQLEGSSENFLIYNKLTLDYILRKISLQKDEVTSYTQPLLAKLSAKEKHILHCYFKEELSLTKTSAALFIHKNTLQYQLKQIHEKTGFDPRKFQEAMMLYLALSLEKLTKKTLPN